MNKYNFKTTTCHSTDGKLFALKFGTCRNVAAAALMMKSLTDNLSPSVKKSLMRKLQ